MAIRVSSVYGHVRVAKARCSINPSTTSGLTKKVSPNASPTDNPSRLIFARSIGLSFMSSSRAEDAFERYELRCDRLNHSPTTRFLLRYPQPSRRGPPRNAQDHMNLANPAENRIPNAHVNPRR